MRRFLIPAALAALLSLPLFTSAQDSGQPQNGAASGDVSAVVTGRSYRDRAEAATGSGDHSEAIYLYRRWLEADPTDANSWYNLACLYSLNASPDKAVDALTRAVATGWNDAAHTRRDPDLDAVRQHKGYLKVLATMEERATKVSQPSFERQHLTLTTTGTYAAYLPPDYADKPDRAYDLVVILHGAGSSDTGHGGSVSRMLGREDLLYIAPRAPYRIDNGGYVAWIPDMERNAESSTRSMTEFCSWVNDCITHAEATYRIRPGRVHVIGHSMGAGAALAFAALYPNRCERVFSYAGYSMDTIHTDARAEVLVNLKDFDVDEKKQRLAVDIVHCEKDAVVPVESSRKAEAWFKKAGVTVSAAYPDVATHSFAPQVRELAVAWAAKIREGAK